MQSQKYENLLNMALEVPVQDREKSQNLNVGYDEASREWEVIVRYNGDIVETMRQFDERILTSVLYGGFAILRVPQEKMGQLMNFNEIEYVEKPKRLYFAMNQVRSVSCVNIVQSPPLRLSGAGTVFALIDSGIDYTHPDFINEDGSSRILYLWDQTVAGEPPAGYFYGREYTNDDINDALRGQVPLGSTDTSGHGTAVAGVAVSNGRSSGGRYRGIAPSADLIVVKLGIPGSNAFPRTTELMSGVDYSIRKAQELGLPVAVNISFGNSYGSHDGTSLLEIYLDRVSDVWKNVICVGAGNEGAAAGHVGNVIRNKEVQAVEFTVAPYETVLNIQIWKNYADEMQFDLISPTGTRITFYQNNLTQRFYVGQVELLVYYGTPRPYSTSQEIYIDFLPRNMYIDSGKWQLEIKGVRIISGQYNLWLPSGGSLNEQTQFLRPTPYRTLTIPSTASKVITVAAYNGQTDSYADFSGRGEEGGVKRLIKPDIAAPGVNITTTGVGGGYASFTGTSFATPVVSGASCLLMQYGIVEGRDDYLYGEKVKAYFARGARQLPGYDTWPNASLGYGALCVSGSLPV